jgi:inorganic pyrophosphatase
MPEAPLHFGHLPPFDRDGNLTVVVETPRGSAHKLAFDDAAGVFRLKKALPLGLAFPFDFGFVPGTRGADGDPLDVLLLLDGSTPPGVVVEARLLGAVGLEHRKDDRTAERNDRLVATSSLSRSYGHFHALEELPPPVLGDLERFFVAYSAALGKDVRILGRLGPDAARELVQAGRTDG